MPELRARTARVARYFQLQALISRERHCLDRAVLDEIRLSIQKVLDFLENELAANRAGLADCLDAARDQQRKIEIMRSAGVPNWAIAILLERLPELGAIDRTAIARISGLTPRGPDGSQADGRDGLRELMFEVAEQIVRSGGSSGATYHRMIANGKVHANAILICARKLLVALNQCIKTDQLWIDTPDE